MVFIKVPAVSWQPSLETMCRKCIHAVMTPKAPAAAETGRLLVPKFEASLGYIWSSRMTSTTVCNPVSKNIMFLNF